MIVQKEVKSLKDYLDKNVNNELIIARSFLEDFISLFGEIQQYRAIGTVEECREARERQIPKKPIHDVLCVCPNCHTTIFQFAFEAKWKCCKECGQALDWGETV